MDNSIITLDKNFFYKKRERMTVKRSEIYLAEYNPRIIAKDALTKLKKSLETYGMADDIIVNKNNNTVIGGHQRLKIMDKHFKYPGKDYELEVICLELGASEEIQLNIILNNPSVQGEYDPDALANIKLSYPNIDLEKDCLFDKSEIDFYFAQTDLISVDTVFQETEERKEMMSELGDITDASEEVKGDNKATADDLRGENKNWAEERKRLDEAGMSRLPEKNDYMLTIVFKNNLDKHEFMKKAKFPAEEKFFKADLLEKVVKKEFLWDRDTFEKGSK